MPVRSRCGATDSLASMEKCDEPKHFFKVSSKNIQYTLLIDMVQFMNLISRYTEKQKVFLIITLHRDPAKIRRFIEAGFSKALLRHELGHKNFGTPALTAARRPGTARGFISRNRIASVDQ
ncbi:hypothetical protein Tsp_08260 [Trichinella spiralis]|nr:hypothetical protein Tsp_08260 [Trichinella spiralis]